MSERRVRWGVVCQKGRKPASRITLLFDALKSKLKHKES